MQESGIQGLKSQYFTWLQQVSGQDARQSHNDDAERQHLSIIP
jgi:hypothetical protein